MSVGKVMSIAQARLNIATVTFHLQVDECTTKYNRRGIPTLEHWTKVVIIVPTRRYLR